MSKLFVRSGTLLAASLLMLAAAGCDEESGYELVFSHYEHVVDMELACSDCHMQDEAGAMIPISHDTCIDCHDDVIEADPGKYTCGTCHQVKDYDALAAQEMPEAEAPSAGIFVHTDALEGKCADCHTSAMDEELDHVEKMTRRDVLVMRDNAHRSGMECASCHVGLEPDIEPPSHEINWMTRHGEKGMNDANACVVCHSEQSCSECHQEMMPRSHNTLWRLETHGIEASWDMDRCQVCHLKESCDACHQEIAPRSHMAGWERRHCQECHLSTETGTGCIFCHEGGIDEHPSPHPAGFEQNHCRGCHDGSPESELCGVCHMFNGLGDHPDPHPANWTRSHCRSCHDGQVDGVSCAACHGGSYRENHVNPHPGSYRTTHCDSCHIDQQANGSCAQCHGWTSLSEHPDPHNAGFANSHCYSCHPGSQSAQECGPCHEGAGSVLVHEDFWPPVHDLFGEAANCFDCHY